VQTGGTETYWHDLQRQGHKHQQQVAAMAGQSMQNGATRQLTQQYHPPRIQGTWRSGIRQHG
jgi:hypothetical protein